MKFGKQKAKDAPAENAPAENPDKKAGKNNKANKDAKAGKGFKRLSSVAINQTLVVILSGVLATALVYFLAVTPAANQQARQARVLEADTAQQRFNQYLSGLQAQVAAVANQRYISDALSDQGPSAELASIVQSALPGASQVYLFGYGNVPRTADSSGLLGFAGLELARRAENGQSLLPDAFPRDNTWYLQFAAPIRHPVSNAVVGSVLAVYDASLVRPLLTVSNQALSGQLSLVQTASGTERTVISAGTGSGPAESRTLLNPDWSIVYQSARSPEPALSLILLGLFIGVPALAAAIVVWLLLGNAQRSIRQDVTGLIQWAHKAFSGERVKPPAFRWDLVGSTGEVLSRLAQVVERRVAKAGENARPKAAPAKTAGKKGKGEEPLFQDKKLPDIDMLDGDEDVLGFGGSPLFDEDIPEVEETTLPSVSVAAEIFRAYDIRGIVGETLSAEVVEVIGRAIGSEAV
ncbi:MAG: phosphomannomutase, partial [Marinobacter sp. 34-60-7]